MEYRGLASWWTVWQWRRKCRIESTSRRLVEGSTNRNNFAILPLFSQPRNSQRPDYSALPKSSWHALLKEHKVVPCNIVVNLGGENLELGFPPRASCMCGWILDRSCREAANQKSRAHKSWARSLSPLSVVDWGSLQQYWCFPSFTWCSNETVVDMWNTSDGNHSVTSLVSAWTARVGGLCGWSFPSPRCNTSIVDKPVQWNTSLCHKWDICGQCLTVICHWMPLLSKECPNSIVRGICLDLKWLLQVW